MLQRIKTLLKAKLFFIAIAITLSIAFLSLVRLGTLPISFSHTDKIAHAIAYFVLCFCWLWAVDSFAKKKVRKLTVVSLCIFYGILIEVVQMTYTNYRTGSLLDILANTTGILLALYCFSSFFEKK